MALGAVEKTWINSSMKQKISSTKYSKTPWEATPWEATPWEATYSFTHGPPNGDVPLIEVYLYSTAKDSFFGDSPYYWFSKIFGHKIFLPQMGGF